MSEFLLLVYSFRHIPTYYVDYLLIILFHINTYKCISRRFEELLLLLCSKTTSIATKRPSTPQMHYIYTDI